MVTNDLLKVVVQPPQIKPVGITPAVNVNGKMAMQTQGKGDGLFKNIINGAAILYSTVKQPGGTIGAVTTPGINAGYTYGTGQDQPSGSPQSQGDGNDTWWNQKILGLPVWQILVGLGLAKLLKLF